MEANDQRGDEAGRARRPRPLIQVSLLLGSAVLAFAIGEVTVRVIGYQNREGVFFFRGAAIPPLPLPVDRTRRMIDEYLQNGDSFIVWDADLGWSPRPSASSRNGMYRSNSAGLRADREYALEPPAEVLRIGMFGDSFAFSADVSQEAALAVKLEERLTADGLSAEVLNFGVGGFGIDQAYLRYLRDGVAFNPDIVIFGLQLENVSRNANVFRPLFFRTSGIPFSKPRFVLRDGELAIINSPTIEPREMPDALQAVFDGPFRDHELYLDDYRPRWYSASRLLSTTAYIFHEKFSPTSGPNNSLVPDGEPMKVTVAILDALASETKRRQQRLVFVFLPRWETLRALEAGTPDPMAPLLRRIQDRFDVLDPTRELFSAIQEQGFKEIVDGHYTPKGNAIVGDVLAKRIEEIARKEFSLRGGNGSDEAPQKAGDDNSPIADQP